MRSGSRLPARDLDLAAAVRSRRVDAITARRRVSPPTGNYNRLVAGYTHKNLRTDVEDMAPQFGLAPSLEARFARNALDVAPATVRAFEAGPEGLELTAFGAPRRAGNDSELQQDWWVG